MAMICIGYEHNDERYPIYMDTDDLGQAEYHYFRKAERMGELLTAKEILRGIITAKRIESDPEFEYLRD